MDVSVLLGAVQNNIYAEMATMFPDKSGGIALSAHEGWRKYCALVGPVATFGYWFAWSTVLSISGLIAGTLLHVEFSSVTYHWSGAHFHVDFAVTLAIVFLLLVYFTNARGIRGTVVFRYVTGALLLIPCLALMFLPYITGGSTPQTFTRTSPPASRRRAEHLPRGVLRHRDRNSGGGQPQVYPRARLRAVGVPPAAQGRVQDGLPLHWLEPTPAMPEHEHHEPAPAVAV